MAKAKMSLLIGKQLETGFPYNLVMPVDQLNGYSFCGSNATLWAEHAGDPNYNLLNQCCLKMNSGNPAELGFTTISQKTMDYMIMEGPGRQDFVRFWRLVAEAVKVRTGRTVYDVVFNLVHPVDI